jgi:hypothetical protein
MSAEVRRCRGAKVGLMVISTTFQPPHLRTSAPPH